ncbi:hypothetical protein FB009_117101 [Sinorhizobium medicae]|uniref:hypothetical protein n=1 Tax=Sinorhizobium medicae TaxID=110321 RepID=UPI00119C7A18|nr:hypothetical protein [Sinorhizobium medicae]MQU78036.1 hypothetical protein [Sinorhizobium medicae]TWA34092.1 hypothetical protein FB009_117101 [Sinorhizobium medicae]
MQKVNEHTNQRQVASIVNQLASQFDGTTGSFSLANSATTTTVSNSKVTTISKVILQPRNTNAGSAGAYISSISNGSFVVGHPSATTVRTFDYVVFGV